MKRFLSLSIFAIACSSLSYGQQIYGLMTKTGSFVTGNNTSYLQAPVGLPVGSIDNSKSTEIAGTGNIFTTKGNTLYYVNFNEPRIYKFAVAADGKLTKLADLLLPDGDQLPHIVDMLIVDEKTAYAMSYNVFRVFKINLETMKVSGTIDLTSLEKTAYETSTPEEMIIRDGKMYVGMWYGSGLQNALVIDTAFVAVCDLSTMKLEKMITDPRTLMVGYGCSAIDAMFMDEVGDIYVGGSDLIDGGQGIGPGGLLRIKKGETTFDKSYFLNLDSLCGNRKTLGTTYLGNGIMYTMAQYPEAINITNPLSRYLDATMKHWRINLVTKAVDELEEMPYSKGLFFSYLTKVGDKYIMPVGGPNNDNAFWELDATTNKAVKKITLAGEPFGLFPINKNITADLGQDKNLQVQTVVFPNPVRDELNVLIAATATGTATIRVVNLMGQTLFTTQRDINSPEILFTTDASTLPVGVYVVEVSTATAKTAVRWVKE